MNWVEQLALPREVAASVCEGLNGTEEQRDAEFFFLQFGLGIIIFSFRHWHSWLSGFGLWITARVSSCPAWRWWIVGTSQPPQSSEPIPKINTYLQSYVKICVTLLCSHFVNAHRFIYILSIGSLWKTLTNTILHSTAGSPCSLERWLLLNKIW